MATIRVYHAKPEFRFPDGSQSFGYFNAEKHPEHRKFITDNPHLYKCVAEIDSYKLSTDPDEMLEMAYTLTNHVYRPWEQNPEVTSLCGNNRSTSVGDVIAIGENSFHVVAFMGFDMMDTLLHSASAEGK